MRCMSESNPPAKVWWEKEGVNGVFSPDREITISPVTRHTAGTYKCVAQNALGLSEPAFVQLDVKCKSSLVWAKMPKNVPYYKKYLPALKVTKNAY